NGTFTVDAAAQLQGKKSMMSPEGGVTQTGHEGHSGSAHKAGPTSSSSTPVLGKAGGHPNLESVLKAYFQLKNALVSGEVTEAATAADTMDKHVGELYDGNQTDSGRAWSGFRNALKGIAASAQLACQRKI